MGFGLLRLGWLFVIFQWVWALPAMNAIRDGGRLPDGKNAPFLMNSVRRGRLLM